jgi:uncharacterized protein (DUF488 family)
MSDVQMQSGETDRLYTVGHSNLEAEALVALLLGAGVTAVADVRSSPYSRRLPHFNRQTLEATLRTNGIAYVFLGAELGGRPASPALYAAEGWADYERVRQTEAFRSGMDRVARGLGRFVVALLCGEEDPLDCHRGLMITPALKEVGLPPRHLRRGGRVETTAQMEERLQNETGLGGLFAESLAEAYRVMNRRKAYRIEQADEF